MTDNPYPDETSRSPYPDGGDADDPILGPDRTYRHKPSASVFESESENPSSQIAVAPPETSPPPASRRPVWRGFDDGSSWEQYDDADYDDDPSDWQDLPRRSSFLFRLAVSAVVVVVSFLTIGTVLTGWMNDQLDPPGPPGESIVIEIPVGATTNDIASILDDSGVVTKSWVFRYYLRYKDAPEFQAGVYEFQEDMAVWEAREVLEAGPAPADLTFVTFVEGLRLEQLEQSMLDQLPDFSSAEIQAAFADPTIRPAIVPPGVNTLEGVVFPATYDVPEEFASDEAGLVRRMVSQFEAVADELGIEERSAALGVTPYEAVIIASLIEEEAAYAPDRVKIARVIYNRLAAGEPLGIDATVLYAVGKDPGDTIFQSDLDFDSPYNTRLNAGIPPTPIAAPGRDSLEAALNPADGDFFFYALTNEGGVVGAHTFSVTQSEHDAAVAECRAQDLGC